MFALHTAHSAAAAAMDTAFRNAAHAHRHDADMPAATWSTRAAAACRAVWRALMA
jgi:hypothetical protein